METTDSMNKKQDLAKVFLDVRKSFRVLAEYQKRVLSIVKYVKEQTTCSGIWGAKRFSDEIVNSKNSSPASSYAKLKIDDGNGMIWSWDFLYGYLFEYYMGAVNTNKVEFSVFQVSDDGYYKAEELDGDDEPDVKTFAPAEDSHTFLVFAAGNSSELWMYEDAKVERDFLSSNDDQYTKIEQGEFFTCKKYDIKLFANQQGTDEVISDFGQIVSGLSGGVRIFKDQFYR